MDYNRDDIHILLIEKISGRINAGDEALVDRLIREDAVVADMWRSLQDTFASPAGREVLDPARHQVFIEKVRSSLHQRQRQKIFRNIAYVAAIAVFLGSFPLWYQLRRAVPENETVTAPQIRLQLGNGRVISLADGASQTIQVENARLRNSHDTLTYTAAGNNMINTLIVPPGKQYTLVLSDGSEIRLNAATRISFPFTFTGRKREISINGEAYFKIARDAGRTFIVHTPQSDIEVLGTSFNVNTYTDSSTTVSLIEGAVKVKAGNSTQLLHPGSQATYTKRDMVITTFDKNETLSWLNGEFFFHDTHLEEIARIISRWYGIKVVLDHPAIMHKRVSGVIDKKKPLGVFLDHLQKTSETTCYYKDNVLHFK